jgi:hypothetical protein
VAVFFDSAAFFSSAAFFASAALVAATPPTEAGLDKTFLFDLQRIGVKRGLTVITYFTVGIAFTPGPTRAPASMASFKGH